MSYDRSQALSHRLRTPSARPAPRRVAIPETTNDIIPERTKPKSAGARRAGISISCEKAARHLSSRPMLRNAPQLHVINASDAISCAEECLCRI